MAWTLRIPDDPIKRASLTQTLKVIALSQQGRELAAWLQESIDYNIAVAIEHKEERDERMGAIKAIRDLLKELSDAASVPTKQ